MGQKLFGLAAAGSDMAEDAWAVKQAFLGDAWSRQDGGLVPGGTARQTPVIGTSCLPVFAGRHHNRQHPNIPSPGHGHFWAFGLAAI